VGELTYRNRVGEPHKSGIVGEHINQESCVGEPHKSGMGEPHESGIVWGA
jgi:hypothetical protein